MSALTFTLKTVPAHRVDCSPLTPDQLTGKNAADIAAVTLQSGKQTLRVDSLFDISGDDANEIVFKNSHTKLDFIGKAMASGSITIQGDVGSYLAFQMKNGTITLHGNASDFAASGMAKGLLHNGFVYVGWYIC